MAWGRLRGLKKNRTDMYIKTFEAALFKLMFTMYVHVRVCCGKIKNYISKCYSVLPRGGSKKDDLGASLDLSSLLAPSGASSSKSFMEMMSWASERSPVVADAPKK